jgi:hypothetical protein
MLLVYLFIHVSHTILMHWLIVFSCSLKPAETCCAVLAVWRPRRGLYIEVFIYMAWQIISKCTSPKLGIQNITSPLMTHIVFYQNYLSSLGPTDLHVQQLLQPLYRLHIIWVLLFHSALVICLGQKCVINFPDLHILNRKENVPYGSVAKW